MFNLSQMTTIGTAQDGLRYLIRFWDTTDEPFVLFYDLESERDKDFEMIKEILNPIKVTGR